MGKGEPGEPGGNLGTTNLGTDGTIYRLFCPCRPKPFGPGMQEGILISVRREIIAPATSHQG